MDISDNTLSLKDLLHLITLLSKHTVLFCSFCNIFWVFVSQSWAEFVRYKLEEEVDWECAQGDKEAPHPLDTCQTRNMDADSSTEELGYHNLDYSDNSPDDDKGWVLQDSFEDIDFIIDLSGADHVEDLHEHEEIEYNGQMSCWSIDFEGFVHWSLLDILYHSFKKVVVSFGPFGLQVFKIIVILSFKFCFNHVELQNLFGSTAFSKIDSLTIIVSPCTTKLFLDEA